MKAFIFFHDRNNFFVRIVDVGTRLEARTKQGMRLALAELE
jgi:hypothetical protein